MNTLETLQQILNVTAPVFAMVFIGWVLKRGNLVNDAFIASASNLTFRATMPTLFFMSIWRADLQQAFNAQLVVFFGLATLAGFAGSWWWAGKRVAFSDRGVFVQGCFRGNCGVVSYALVGAYFGDYGFSVGGVLVGFSILLFNVLSVLVLSVHSPHMTFNLRNVARELATNPLILAVLLGLAASSISLPLPVWVEKSADYFAGLTLPLALICVGATLSLAGLRATGRPAVEASLIKIAILPVAATALSWFAGMEGEHLIILWMFLATPTAAASFAMAVAAGGDGRLAANIIALTTLVSLLSMTGGVFMLRILGH